MTLNPEINTDDIVADQLENRPTDHGQGGAGLALDDGQPWVCPSQWAHLKDRNRDGFHPDKHETHPDGSPVVNPSGTLKLKAGPGPRPGKKGKSFIGVKKTRERSGADPAGQLDQAAGADPADQLDQAAELTPEQKEMQAMLEAEIMFTIYRVAGGLIDRRFMQTETAGAKMAREALLNHIRLTGGLNMPPWVHLAAGLLGGAAMELVMLGRLKLPASILAMAGPILGQPPIVADMSSCKVEKKAPISREQMQGMGVSSN